MTERPLSREAPLDVEEGDTAWSADAAWKRIASDEPLIEDDDAFLWWNELGDLVTYKAAKAIEHLREKEKIPEEYAWLRSYESWQDFYGLPADACARLGKAYIDGLAPAERTSPEDAVRAAAEYLILYGEVADLTSQFAGALGETPNPQLSVNAARCAVVCTKLGGLGEAFDPEHGGRDPQIANQVERQHQARLKGGMVRAERADETWRTAVLEMAKEIRRAHPHWGDGAVARKIIENPPSGMTVRQPLTLEKVRKYLAHAGASGLLDRSLFHPSVRPLPQGEA